MLDDLMALQDGTTLIAVRLRIVISSHSCEIMRAIFENVSKKGLTSDKNCL